MSDVKKRAAPHGPQEYLGNQKHAWEVVVELGTAMPTYRLRVPGGWLYRFGTLYTNSASLAFVPVPQAVGYKV